MRTICIYTMYVMCSHRRWPTYAARTAQHSSTARRDVFSPTPRIARRGFDDRVSPRRNARGPATTMFMFNIWGARAMFMAKLMARTRAAVTAVTQWDFSPPTKHRHPPSTPLPHHCLKTRTYTHARVHAHTFACTRTSNEPGERDYRPFVRRDT